jgi:hypothetical protein
MVPTPESPGVAHDALAGVTFGDVGEFPLEGGGDREAVQPFHFRGGGGKGRLPRASATPGRRLIRPLLGAVYSMRGEAAVDRKCMTDHEARTRAAQP